MNKILIIEDDNDIAEVERDYLLINGFEADITDNGITGIDKIKQGNYDLVLLDLMLPGLDGFTVCKRLREIMDISILMVTARKEDIDKIRGLGLGADDYVEKPFSPNVLVARVKANLQQYSRLKNNNVKKESIIDVGDYKINTSSHRVYKHGREVELKNKEYELFLFLVMNADIMFDKEYIQNGRNP